MSKKNVPDRGGSDDLARAVREELRLLREDLEGASPAVRSHLQRLVPIARSSRSDMPTSSELPALLVDLYSYARPTDRRAILDAGVRRLSAIATEAAAHPRSERAEILRHIGAACEPLVLEGTVYQQLVSAFAVKLGSLAVDDLARLRGPVVTPLVRALVTLLRVGAPNTRDSAVEGLGALLKGVKDDAEKEAPFHDLVPVAAEDASAVALQYISRLKRRKTMSLTVAGHTAASREFLDRLRTSVATVVAEIRKKDESPEAIREALKTALYDRADLLRTLPALLRQGRIEAQEAIRYLRDDARLPPMREDEDESVAVAFARFQESVFRTIDVLIKREGASIHLDQSIAEAVDAIPATIVGSPALCNYQIRATIAILQAAVRLVERDGQGSPTWAALLPIFRGLCARPAPWLNPGIAEGCYRGLPFLLANPEHDELVRPALAALFKHLRRHHDPNDYAETHRQLIANACFRRILIRRMELAADHDPRDLAAGDEAVVEHDVRALLLAPDTEHVLAVFRGHEPLPEPGRVVRRGVAETLLSGIAFESDLLRRGAATFRRWPEHAPVDRVLLTRILAAELRASSQDARELARYSMLTRLYGGLPTITLAEEKRLGFVWDLLAALPPEAAGAADADLEDFVDHCGRRNRSSTSKRQVEDLPGHVLAMISDAPSDGIAAAIAREMDLNRRHEWERDQGFDLGTLLYQVMLRGPDKSVFEHLLPRVDDPNDRALVKLFLHHVEAVQRNPLADDVYAMEPLLEHIRSILDSKEEVRSRTLDRLKEALRLYADLAADDSKVWPTIAEGDQIGGVGRLFSALDDIANETHKRASGNDGEPDAATHRTSLVKAYEEASAQLQ
ncbi:MAG TPA: hypothetical protein VN605_04425, partial [Thermoanaerobaculia bacterium]|nr:hypothetical protein [Thermoanaerobaculia bacterium]